MKKLSEMTREERIAEIERRRAVRTQRIRDGLDWRTGKPLEPEPECDHKALHYQGFCLKCGRSDPWPRR